MAHNRYQIFGLVRCREDLFKLDWMVFALRRICVPLDAHFLGKQRPDKMNLTHRDLLMKQPKVWTVCLTYKLERTAVGKRREQLREVLCNLNLPFAPDDFQHGSLRTGTAAQNPVLGRSILKPLEQAPDSDAAVMAVQICDWVLKNIQLPWEVEAELREASRKGIYRSANGDQASAQRESGAGRALRPTSPVRAASMVCASAARRRSAGSTKIRGVKPRERLPSEGRAGARHRRLDIRTPISAALTPRILVLPFTGMSIRKETFGTMANE